MSLGIRMQFTASRGGFTVDAEAELPGQGVTGLFGRSGAGKTSLLRLMAGLDRASHAYFEVNGDILDDSSAGVRMPAHRRRIAVVFQEPRLFGHLDVEANIRYGAKRADAPPIAGFEAVVEMLGIGALLARRPGGLSGGEAQRVAIARALMSAPRLVLMDEPLASLDRARRDEILPFLEALHADLPVPMLYVSHQQEELLRLADHVALVEAGRLSRHGGLAEMLADAEAFPGEARAAVLDGTARATDTEFGLTEVGTAAGPFWVTALHDPGTPLRLIVRANDISVSRTFPEASSVQNSLPATIAAIENEDRATALLVLDCRGQRLFARVTTRAIARLGLAPGQAVFALVKTAAVRKAAGAASVPVPA
ncbi:MAG: molybdenum ABC transporter ATP-binding protein [Woeseiaceae bacterium]|jgi:molybdate transport system ATP-binding protein|nr:molybdenum ABC transporter ATP-binding protein [Woeseiaceae bacterium]